MCMHPTDKSREVADTIGLVCARGTCTTPCASEYGWDSRSTFVSVMLGQEAAVATQHVSVSATS
jgi:hypothetical protein